jgi:hypothetical protein
MQIKPYVIFTGMIAVLLNCCTADASWLLGQLDGGTFRFYGLAYPSLLTTTGMQCYMGYTDPLYDLGDGQGLRIDQSLQSQNLWVDLPSLGSRLVFDFPVAGHPICQSIAAKLTDGINEPLKSGVFTYNGDGLLTGGAYGSVGDRYGFLAGSQIDWLRLNVTQVSWGPIGSSLYNIDVTYSWQAYGVPEPSVLALGVLGGLMLLRRRRA